MEKIMIGWQEWCAFPELGLKAIKAKVDTGATTTALHAFHQEPFKQNGKDFLRFAVHPLQKRTDIIKFCTAPLCDKRVIVDSGGHKEERYVIQTMLALGGQEWPIEMTLTDREAMKYRMLLGRRAMKNRILLDPSASFLLGKLSAAQVKRYYLEEGVSS